MDVDVKKLTQTVGDIQTTLKPDPSGTVLRPEDLDKNWQVLFHQGQVLTEAFPTSQNNVQPESTHLLRARAVKLFGWFTGAGLIKPLICSLVGTLLFACLAVGFAALPRSPTPFKGACVAFASYGLVAIAVLLMKTRCSRRSAIVLWFFVLFTTLAFVASVATAGLSFNVINDGIEERTYSPSNAAEDQKWWNGVMILRIIPLGFLCLAGALLGLCLWIYSVCLLARWFKLNGDPFRLVDKDVFPNKAYKELA